jgi:hypothetical protein
LKIHIVDDNLLWTSRLRKSLAALGHTSVSDGKAAEPCDLAIVNLSSKRTEPLRRITELKALNARVVCHAGHKEKQLLHEGREAGCDLIATHSELTFKLESVLKAANDG